MKSGKRKQKSTWQPTVASMPRYGHNVYVGAETGVLKGNMIIDKFIKCCIALFNCVGMSTAHSN